MKLLVKIWLELVAGDGQDFVRAGENRWCRGLM